MSCDENVFNVFGFGWGKLDLRPTFDRLFKRSRHGRCAVSRREVRAWLFTGGLLVLEAELESLRAFHRSYHESPDDGVMLLSLWKWPLGPGVTPVKFIRSARVGGRALNQEYRSVVRFHLNSLPWHQ